MTQLNKTRVVKFLLTPDELVRLKAKSEASGFVCLSQYARFMLLNDYLTERRIKELHDKIILEKEVKG